MTNRPLLALDRASKRDYDEKYGYLRVYDCKIGIEGVFPYLGREIPGWEEQGLDPDKTYMAYRPASELAKAVETFHGVPLTYGHHVDSADDPQKEHRVGSIGTDVRMDGPYMLAALIVTDAEAIGGIESGDMREISPAYGYTPVFEPGEFEGKKYDFVMTEIHGNHVALVEKARGGPDLVVEDQHPDVGKGVAMSRRNGRKRRSLREVAKDENILNAVEEALEAVEGGASPEEVLAKEIEEADVDTTASSETANDDGRLDEIAGLLTGVEEEQRERIMAAIRRLLAPEEATDEKDDDKKKEPAMDAAPKPVKQPSQPPAPVALDEAKLRAELKAEVAAIHQAVQDVRPLIGDSIANPMAMDAAGIYDMALKAVGVDTTGVPKPGLGPLVREVAKLRAKETLAQDRAAPTELEGPFKVLGNIKL